MKMRYLLVFIGIIATMYNQTKDITFTNTTDRPIVLKITPGRSSKFALSTSAFDTILAPQQKKVVAVYSEQFGGKGKYINDLQISWGDKDVNFFFKPEFDPPIDLNTFIQSKSSKQPLEIKWVPQFDRTTFEETGGSFKVVIPEVPEVMQQRKQDIIETHRQAREAKRGLERAWRLFTTGQTQ